MQIRAIIVDDEPKLIESLEIKLSRYCSDVNVVSKCMSIDDAYHKIKENGCDIIFLDINMPGGTGFDLLDRFENREFEVIFVTAFSEYAIQAIKRDAIDYILKPISTKELITAFNKAKYKIKEKAKVRSLESEAEQEETVCIPSESDYEFIKVKDIVRCEGYQRYTKIFLKSKTFIVSSYSIGIYVDKLSKYNFSLVHRSHLINHDHIVSYNAEGVVTLSDGSEVNVSRRKRDNFYKTFISKIEK